MRGEVEVGGGGGGRGEEDSVLPSLRLSIATSFCSIYSYSTVNHVLERERERVGVGGGWVGVGSADGSGVFFFSFFFHVLILPFEPAMWKSAGSASLHGSPAHQKAPIGPESACRTPLKPVAFINVSSDSI